MENVDGFENSTNQLRSTVRHGSMCPWGHDSDAVIRFTKILKYK